ncbi:MAG: DUF481 domain-containing protein [Verrucomicrobiota bacterium]|nr:DUF481 domain-containing protein [Verrucomicrobiota bacterium]
MKKIKKYIFAVITFIVTVSIHANTLVLQGGSVLKGKILKSEAKGVLIQVLFQQKPLSISFENIEKINFDKASDMPKDFLKSVSADLIELPPKKKKKELDSRWAYSAEIDLSGETGNSEKESLSGAITALKENKEFRLENYLYYFYSKENRQKDDDQFKAYSDYSHKFSERDDYFIKLQYETDRIDDLDYRLTLSSGYGYSFIKEDSHFLLGRIGANVTHEKYIDQSPDTSPGLFLGGKHRYDYKDLWSIRTNVEFIPELQSGTKFIMNHETFLDIPLDSNDKWKLRIGVKNDYESETPDDVDHLDTEYFFQACSELEVNFK